MPKAKHPKTSTPKLDDAVRKFVNGGYSVPRWLRAAVIAEADRTGDTPSAIVRRAVMRDLKLSPPRS